MNDIVLTNCTRETAKAIAKEGLKSGDYFQKKYGLLWPMKYSSAITAAFVQARLQELGRPTFETAQKEITVDYIRGMFVLNNMPLSLLWIGDITMQMFINTFLEAFINNGNVRNDDDTVEDMGEYTAIRNEMCKLHGKYKGCMIYRAWNIQEGHGKMRYFGVKDDCVIATAKNLSGVKDEISKVI